MISKVVHISIDDIGKSLRWLSYNRPHSIFDMRIFGQLKVWHEAYGCKFTLYCFAIAQDFLITEIPLVYGDELRENSSWLRFGFHGKIGTNRFFDEKGYKAGYELFERSLFALGIEPSQIIRLHNWLATDEQKRYLREKGIKVLLYPDDEKMRYSEDSFCECGLDHWRTRLRIENVQNINEETCCIGLTRVVVFTHEKCFDDQRGKIEEAVSIYLRQGYIFL